eukprot:197840_1
MSRLVLLLSITILTLFRCNGLMLNRRSSESTLHQISSESILDDLSDNEWSKFNYRVANVDFAFDNESSEFSHSVTNVDFAVVNSHKSIHINTIKNQFLRAISWDIRVELYMTVILIYSILRITKSNTVLLLMLLSSINIANTLPSMIPTSSPFRLQSIGTYYCVFDDGFTFSSASCSQLDKFQWKLDSYNEPWFSIKSKQTGRCIINRPGSYDKILKPDGNYFTVSSCSGTSDQLWRANDANNYVLLQNQATSKCMFNNNNPGFGVRGCTPTSDGKLWKFIPTPTQNPTTEPTANPTAPTAKPTTKPTDIPTMTSFAPTAAPSLPPTKQTVNPTKHPTITPSSAPTFSSFCINDGREELILELKDVSNGLFSSALKNSGTENTNDSTTNTYSIIGELDPNNYMGSDNKYEFHLIWNGDTFVDLRWKQSLWLTEQWTMWPVTGYEEISMNPIDSSSGDDKFYGLGLSNHPECYLDGTGMASDWWNCVGCMVAWNGGIPGYNRYVSQTQILYACNTQTPSPTHNPSSTTIEPTPAPSVSPTHNPSNSPSNYPSDTPTNAPSTTPTYIPTVTTYTPTNAPSVSPTSAPTVVPTDAPSYTPSIAPTTAPTATPTNPPSYAPSTPPTTTPTTLPTSQTLSPTSDPTDDPTTDPTFDPTSDPTFDPTFEPTFYPTVYPTTEPTIHPSLSPTLPCEIRIHSKVVIAPLSPMDNPAFECGVTVTLKNDTRNINKITTENEWILNQNHNNPLYDWGLEVVLNGNIYGFEPGISTVSIDLDGYATTNECDLFFAFSIGDIEYLTFMTGVDGNLIERNNTGTFIYPPCGSTNIANGAATTLIPVSNLSQFSLKNALAGGNMNNWHHLSSDNENNTQLSFTLINNVITNTFTVRFQSSYSTSTECTYNSIVPMLQDFKMFISPGVFDEEYKIRSINVARHYVPGIEMCVSLYVTVMNANGLFNFTHFNGVYTLDPLNTKFNRPIWNSAELSDDKSIHYFGATDWIIKGIGLINILSYTSNNYFPPINDTAAKWRHSHYSGIFHVLIKCSETQSPTFLPTTLPT